MFLPQNKTILILQVFTGAYLVVEQLQESNA